MKRRNFNLLAGTSMAALMGPSLKAFAQSSPTDFATLSQTTLTPFGAERAGNAAGTIPAWTGGMTTVSGFDPATEMPPDFFASDSLLYTVDASNLAQYGDLVSEGVKTLITKQGLSLQVFPTHRPAAAPQAVYDSIAVNAGSAKMLDPANPQTGFVGAYGGIPFPVPDASNPLIAGAQIIWNHLTRWQGVYQYAVISAWTCVQGHPVYTSAGTAQYFFPYYDPKGSLATYNGYNFYELVYINYPPNSAGEILDEHEATNPLKVPTIIWQLQLGQGRVRKAPELTYDTPTSFSNGIANFDEFNGFYGAPDEYDWKLIGKQEMLIPYNNNKMVHSKNADFVLPKFLNPDITRWELHRVWVVDATLHPGKRNVLAHRRMYFDEDTWQAMLLDGYDANGNIYHHSQTFTLLVPQLPGQIYLNAVVYNLQTGDYSTINGPSGDPPYNTPLKFTPVPMSTFEPQTMAADATY